MKSRERILDETVERQARYIARMKEQEETYKALLKVIRDAINVHLGGDGSEKEETDETVCDSHHGG